MATLAIKGHVTRGKEVIEILEMLGGENKAHLKGTDAHLAYYIYSEGYIDTTLFTASDKRYKGFTLEEFLERFPYKVGDKVHHIIDNENQIITDLVWDEDEVLYKTTNNFGYVYVNYLQPYKEETMESKPDLLQQLKEYFDNTPRDILEKEWNELSYLNEIGPSVNEYLECVKKYRQLNQYPKNYEECCNILHIEPNRIIEYDDCLGYRDITQYDINLLTQLKCFRRLLICRDAYWKIAGEEMGLDKLWKPYNGQESCKKHVIQTVYNNITCLDTWCQTRNILEFPTEEMRDAFYENFKELIESCKELL